MNTSPRTPTTPKTPRKRGRPRVVRLQRRRLTVDQSGVIHLDGVPTRLAPLFRGTEVDLPEECLAEVAKHADELRPLLAADGQYWPIGIIERRGVVEIVRNTCALQLAAACKVPYVFVIRVDTKALEPNRYVVWEHFWWPTLLRAYTHHPRLLAFVRESVRRRRPLIGKAAPEGDFRLTVEEFAALLKVDAKTVRVYLRGHVTDPPTQPQPSLPMTLPRARRQPKRRQKPKAARPVISPSPNAADRPLFDLILDTPDATARGQQKQVPGAPETPDPPPTAQQAGEEVA